MKFIAFGKYSNSAFSGFIANPEQDRKVIVSTMMSKAGGELEDFYLTRGEFDFVAIGTVNKFETLGAVKMVALASGAFSELEALEVTDFNEIAKKAASIMNSYKAPDAT